MIDTKELHPSDLGLVWTVHTDVAFYQALAADYVSHVQSEDLNYSMMGSPGLGRIGVPGYGLVDGVLRMFDVGALSTPSVNCNNFSYGLLELFGVNPPSDLAADAPGWGAGIPLDIGVH